MTDEEKANEYANMKGFWDGYNDITSDEANEGIKKAYLEGLTEGRKLGKEEQWKATEKAQKKTSARINKLEEENKKLKEKIRNLNSSLPAWQKIDLTDLEEK